MTTTPYLSRPERRVLRAALRLVARTEAGTFTAADLGLNGSPAYHEASARDAWMRALDWLADTTTGATETE